MLEFSPTNANKLGQPTSAIPNFREKSVREVPDSAPSLGRRLYRADPTANQCRQSRSLCHSYPSTQRETFHCRRTWLIESPPVTP